MWQFTNLTKKLVSSKTTKPGYPRNFFRTAHLGLRALLWRINAIPTVSFKLNIFVFKNTFQFQQVNSQAPSFYVPFLNPIFQVFERICTFWTQTSNPVCLTDQLEKLYVAELPARKTNLFCPIQDWNFKWNHCNVHLANKKITQSKLQFNSQIPILLNFGFVPKKSNSDFPSLSWIL